MLDALAVIMMFAQGKTSEKSVLRIATYTNPPDRNSHSRRYGEVW
jgi:hypothetical protein